MKWLYRATIVVAIILTGCTDDVGVSTETATQSTNPLLEEWDTPFGVPPFDRIESEHYLPAIRAGMAEQKNEIDAIVANPDEPTFANTIEAYENSGRAYARANTAFGAVNGAHSDDVTKETAKTIAPERSAHTDDIRLNADLFKRVKQVYDGRGDLSLGDEQQRLLEETYKIFIRSGINLDDTSQGRLREINAELATLTTKFRDNLLIETNDFELLVTDRADLGGLPDSLVALAAEEATRRGHECDCWAFTLQRPSINPFLQYSPNREMRKKMYDGYAMRGDNDNDFDNKEVLSRIVQLRAERAALKGFGSHADFVLTERMAEKPELVFELLDKVWTPALRVAKEEHAARQEMMNADGIDGELECWVWR